MKKSAIRANLSIHYNDNIFENNLRIRVHIKSLLEEPLRNKTLLYLLYDKNSSLSIILKISNDNAIHKNTLGLRFLKQQ